MKVTAWPGAIKPYKQNKENRNTDAGNLSAQVLQGDPVVTGLAAMVMSGVVIRDQQKIPSCRNPFLWERVASRP